MEHRPRRGGRQPRLQGAAQGWLLPGRAVRPLRRPARRDGRRAAGRRPRDRAGPPRGRAPPGRPRSTTSSTRSLRGRRPLMLFKYVVKNVAWAATARPHLHAQAALRRQRLRHALPPVAVEGRRADSSTTRSATRGLSDTARHYIGGLLSHAPSLLAFTNPTTNSYHRLVPGYEAPINLVYCQRNRSACCRIPITGSQPEGQAGRVPRPGPVVQPLPRVLRDADGRPRRHQEQDRAARTPIDKDLYELPPERGASPLRRSRRRWTGSSNDARGRPRLPARRRRVHLGPDRDLDRLQARSMRSTRSGCGRTRTSSRCTTTSEPLARAQGHAGPGSAQADSGPKSRTSFSNASSAVIDPTM